MYGWGIVRTLGMTLYHFIMTYVKEIRDWWSHRGSSDNGAQPGDDSGFGIFTVKYPDERLQVTERYRNLPFFVIDAKTEQLRCTACGVCAQICPVQCIWIERARDPETGRPRRYPLTYYLDVSLCMSCGFCAEFCPFDAIKMDQEFELATFQRPGFVSARDLAKPEAYHARIHPSAYEGDVPPQESED
jgi:NADH-quinone oxidoreductase subunit I